MYQRRNTQHNQSTLSTYLKTQTAWEKIQLGLGDGNGSIPRHICDATTRTIYMDGVFDLFHFGHLKAIEECAKLGDRVIIGVTGDSDATQYKRAPIMNEAERTSIVTALKQLLTRLFVLLL